MRHVSEYVNGKYSLLDMRRGSAYSMNKRDRRNARLKWFHILMSSRTKTPIKASFDMRRGSTCSIDKAHVVRDRSGLRTVYLQ